LQHHFLPSAQAKLLHKSIPASINAKANIRAGFGSLPLSFEPNLGQSRSQAKFLARGTSFGLLLSDSAAIIAIPQRPSAPGVSKHAVRPDTTSNVKIEFKGANHSAQPTGADPLIGKVNYLGKKYPNGGIRNIPTFSKVEYQSIYPNIDLAYHGTRRQLEYDLIVAPGADPNLIRIRFTGPDLQRIRLNSTGDLLLETPAGQLIEQKPVIYQDGDVTRHEVAGHYRLFSKNVVGFEVSAYDRTRPLVIDPTLVYTMGGGAAAAEGVLVQSNGVAVDPSGNVYVVGTTGIGATNGGGNCSALVSGFSQCGQALLLKLNATGNVIYETSFGEAQGSSVAADFAGNAYIAGIAEPSALSTTSNAFQPSANDASCPVGIADSIPCSDGFVGVLNPDGTAFTYLSYLGGSNNDSANGIAVDSAGAMYVTGQTESADFPVTHGAYQTTFDTSKDVGATFVAKIDPTKSGTASLIYSTLLGGGTNPLTITASEGDQGNGIAVDQSGNAYITGVTYSSTLATPGAFQSTLPEPQSPFVAKFNSTGSNLVWATYLGGTISADCQLDSGNAIAVDGAGNSYVTGVATTSDFPTTPGAFQPSLTSTSNAFVSKLNATGTALIYSTLLGGSIFPPGFDLTCPAQQGNGIAIDANGDAFVAGFTHTVNFPIGASTLEPAYKFAPPGTVDNTFVAQLNNTGQSLLFSTYLTEYSGNAIALDNAGGVYVAGGVAAPYSGAEADYVAKIDLNASGPAFFIVPASLAFNGVTGNSTSAPQVLAIKNVGNAPLDLSGITITIDETGGGFAQTNNCPSALGVGATCSISVTYTPVDGDTTTATLNIVDNAPDSPQKIDLYGNDSGAVNSISANSLAFSDTAVGSASAPQVVTLASSGTATLAITSIVATGDFAETDNCITALPISTTCQISVTFKPSATGKRAGSLVITDNGGNATVSLTGTGQAVPLTVTASSSSQTVTAGQTATYTLQISAPAGFMGSVTVGCSGAPSGASCSASSPITLNGATPVTEKVMVTTTANSFLALHRQESDRLKPASWYALTSEVKHLNRSLRIGAALLVALSGFFLVFSSNQFSRKRTMYLCGFILAACATIGGCGGGNNSGGGTNGTPAGTYTLTVTFTGGGSTKTVPLTLIVQ
jgi:hypothetical protein